MVFDQLAHFSELLRLGVFTLGQNAKVSLWQVVAFLIQLFYYILSRAANGKMMD